MCDREHLARLESDFDYLLWRAQVHRFSAAEVESALATLRARALALCPNAQSSCGVIDGFLQGQEERLRQLLAQAASHPPSGLADAP